VANIVEKGSSLITVKSNVLEKVQHSIDLTNKILNSSTDEIFNKAFCLLNSEAISYGEKNYYSLLKSTPSILKTQEFQFIAKSKEDYNASIKLFGFCKM